jgi:cyclic pyranopterin phosphate synthase
MKKLTHLDSKGRAKMVDVSGKPVSEREAVAKGAVYMKTKTLMLIKEGSLPKGDVLAAAKIAGIMAAKKTPELIPLCHPLEITSIDVEIRIDMKKKRVEIESKVKTAGRTGVEMEALTAVAASALTIYDMCKAADKEMTISDIVLLEKKGGRSGPWRRGRD